MLIQNQLFDHLFRLQSGKMASVLIGKFGFEHTELVDDVIQDTFLAALKIWGMKGVPEQPEAWLMKVAINKSINELKKRGRHHELNKSITLNSDNAVSLSYYNHQTEKSIQLKALFGCCSSLLPVKSQLMLTLKLVCGFGDKEIASAFFMESSAVRKAIYRAKNKLQTHQNYFLNLTETDLIQRLPIVEMVLYLMFNEGYSSSSGEQEINSEISFEAMRLTEWIIEQDSICEASTHALFALMLFLFARFEARVTGNGLPVSIEHQDRSLWNMDLIKRGLYHQKLSRETDKLSRFHIESGIAAIHCTAPTYSETNWDEIVKLYRQLLLFDSSIQVLSSLAIALCEKGDVNESIAMLKELESTSDKQFSVLFAALGRVHEKIGSFEKAKSYYIVAKEYSKTRFETAFLDEKLIHLTLKSMPNQN